MMRIMMVFLLLLAICSSAWAGGPAQPTDFATLLSGSSIPLALTLKDLDNSWRRFSASGAQEPGSIYAAMYGMPGIVYYSKGQTVTAVAGETYLVAYSLQAKRPSYAGMMMGRGGAPQPEALTAASPVGLSLLNVRTMGNLAEIRSFDRDAEIAAYAKSFEELAAAASGPTDETPSALSNLKNVAIAVEMFATDYDKLPPMKTPEDFRKVLEEYVKNDDVFKDPGTGEYYAINSSLSDKSVSEIKDPATMVVAYQATPGKDGKRGVAFVDGHVQQVSEDQWKELRAGSNIP